jgi:hypothetical protein
MSQLNSAMKQRFTRLEFVAMLALVVLLSQGCATAGINIQVLVPAQISVPADIQMLALVNRYRPEKGQGALNVIEGALTGENIGQDRRSAEAALGGLTNALAGSPRFTITRPAIELKGTGRGDFPDPLPLAEVSDICAKSNAQALVTIEAFDSDQNIQTNPVQRERKTKEGNVEKYTVWQAQKSINVTVGWRMYEAKSGALVDEFRMYETVRFSAEGNTQSLATNNLPQGEAVTQEIGRVTGSKYSQRISPTWLWVNRMYYKTGNDQLKAGKRCVKFKDWEGAETQWQNALADPKLKNQGRAMYNLAFAAEMRGDLDEALKNANEAGQKYQNRKALDYSYTLRQRIADQQRLEQQMEGAPK